MFETAGTKTSGFQKHQSALSAQAGGFAAIDLKGPGTSYACVTRGKPASNPTVGQSTAPLPRSIARNCTVRKDDMHDQNDQALEAQKRAAREAYERDLSRFEADQSFVAAKTTPEVTRKLSNPRMFFGETVKVRGGGGFVLHNRNILTGPLDGFRTGHMDVSRDFVERPLTRSRLTGSKRCKQTRVDVSSHSPRARVAPSEVWRSNTPYPPIVAIYVQGRFRVRYAFDTTDRVYVRMDRQF